MPENFITKLVKRLIGVRVPEKVYELLRLRLGLSSFTNERVVTQALEHANAPDLVARMNQLQQRFDDLEERWNRLRSAYAELEGKYCSEHYRLFESEQTNNALTLGAGAIMSENERLRAENAKLKTLLTGEPQVYTSPKDSDDPLIMTFVDKWNKRLDAMTSRPDRRSGGETGKDDTDGQQDHVD